MGKISGILSTEITPINKAQQLAHPCANYNTPTKSAQMDEPIQLFSTNQGIASTLEQNHL